MNDKFSMITETIFSRQDLSPDNIPQIDLYMDQIMTIFDHYLSDYKRNEDDKLLTKTMINNYSKAGILKPLKGKKYSREHILQMIIIYYLKNTISIQEIKKILEPYHEESIEPIYQEFLDKKTALSEACKDNISAYLKEFDIDLNNKEDLIVTTLVFCEISNLFKNIAEKMLDDLYE